MRNYAEEGRVEHTGEGSRSQRGRDRMGNSWSAIMGVVVTLFSLVFVPLRYFLASFSRDPEASSYSRDA